MLGALFIDSLGLASAACPQGATRGAEQRPEATAQSRTSRTRVPRTARGATPEEPKTQHAERWLSSRHHATSGWPAQGAARRAPAGAASARKSRFAAREPKPRARWAGHRQREMQTLSATDAFRALIAEVIASL